MGAFEFHLVTRIERSTSNNLEVSESVNLVQKAVSRKTDLKTNFIGYEVHALRDIIRVSTYADSARVKAFIAINKHT